MRRAFRSWERGEPPEPTRPELQTLGRLMEAGGCAPTAGREAATADPTAKSMVGWERHTCRSVELSSGTGYVGKGIRHGRPTAKSRAAMQSTTTAATETKKSQAASGLAAASRARKTLTR